MEYSIKELSRLAGVSARTLRYYDEIGLLSPLYVNDAGYRFYGKNQLDLLQQILFYRERGFGLKKIRDIIYSEDFDVMSALREHLQELEMQAEKTQRLIDAVQRTIGAMKGECEMNDKEKFEAFKEKAVRENEAAYGKEVREKYGDGAMDEANRKVMNMSQADYERFKNLGDEIQKQLETAVINQVRPESDAGRRIVVLHKEWLGMTWKSYSAQAHQALAMQYTLDERFTAWYDRNVEGCARFLTDAVGYWAGQE